MRDLMHYSVGDCGPQLASTLLCPLLFLSLTLQTNTNLANLLIARPRIPFTFPVAVLTRYLLPNARVVWECTLMHVSNVYGSAGFYIERYPSLCVCIESHFGSRNPFLIPSATCKDYWRLCLKSKGVRSVEELVSLWRVTQTLDHR